jgi:hypothetical protein
MEEKVHLGVVCVCVCVCLEASMCMGMVLWTEPRALAIFSQVLYH